MGSQSPSSHLPVTGTMALLRPQGTEFPSTARDGRFHPEHLHKSLVPPLQGHCCRAQWERGEAARRQQRAGMARSGHAPSPRFATQVK